MIRGGISVGLPGLRHQVAEINFDSWRRLNRRSHAAYQEIRNDAGVETARPDDDRIGAFERIENTGRGNRIFRFQPYLELFEREERARPSEVGELQETAPDLAQGQ